MAQSRARTRRNVKQLVAHNVERHSIDYIPKEERHGKVWHQGPFWFTGNFLPLTLAVGFIGPMLGLGLWWSILAIVTGGCFGTFFMAFHANQGPTLGIPQMIQSRAQFGFRGAVVPFVIALVVYIGLNTFNVVFSTNAFQSLVGFGGRWFWYILITVLTIFLAVVGHDLLLLVQRWLGYAFILGFSVLTVGSVLDRGWYGTADVSGFGWVAFLGQFAAAAGLLMSYAIYVSDYTRYMPEDTQTWKMVAWTYLGAISSTAWLCSLGAYFAVHLGATIGAAESLQMVGDKILPGLGGVVLFISAIGLVTMSGVNLYGSMLSALSLVDAFKRIKPTVSSRVIGIAGIGLLCMLLAATTPAAFINSLGSYLTFLLYLLVPWTAVNLVDYYFVRHGHYSVKDILNPGGLYGPWEWRGLIAYFAGSISMVPFMMFFSYVGPGAAALGNVDVSYLVGLPVAGLVYYIACRSLDTEKELEGIAVLN